LSTRRSSDLLGFVFFADARNELRQFSKVPQLLAPAGGVRAAGGRQNIHTRSVEHLLLNAKFALSLRKLLVGQFAIECHDVRSEFLKLLRENDSSFGVVFALQFFYTFVGADQE